MHSSSSSSSAEETYHEDPNNAIDTSPSLSFACRRFNDTIKRMQTSCFIAIDEARELHDTHDHRELLRGDRKQQLSHFLCRVISNITTRYNCPIWTIFSSTISSLTDFAGPKRIRMCQVFIRCTTYLKNVRTESSTWVIDSGVELFRPFTRLNAHVMAKNVDEILPADVWKVGTAVGFGRPL